MESAVNFQAIKERNSNFTKWPLVAVQLKKNALQPEKHFPLHCTRGILLTGHFTLQTRSIKTDCFIHAGFTSVAGIFVMHSLSFVNKIRISIRKPTPVNVFSLASIGKDREKYLASNCQNQTWRVVWSLGRTSSFSRAWFSFLLDVLRLDGVLESPPLSVLVSTATFSQNVARFVASCL